MPLEKIFDYVDYLVKPPLEQLGGIMGDTVGHWRMKNQERIIESVKKRHLERSITPKQMPLKTFAAIMNYSSWEEDERLVYMWSNLLADATDPSSAIDYHHIFAKILSELSSQEALLLTKMVPEKGMTKTYHPSQFNTILGLDHYEPQGKLIANNLSRLGLLHTHQFGRTGIGRLMYSPNRSLTELGKQFLVTCNS